MCFAALPGPDILFSPSGLLPRANRDVGGLRLTSQPRIKRLVAIAVLLIGGFWLFVDSSAWRWLARAVISPPRPAKVTGRFDRPLDAFRISDNRDLVERFRRQGIDLSCSVPVERANRISEEDALVCWGWIASAWDIPATQLALFFNKEGQLNYVRVEFPTSSFGAVQSYLRDLERTGRCPFYEGLGGFDAAYQRIDGWFCSPYSPNGLVTANGFLYSNEPAIVLWTSMRIVLTDLKKRLKNVELTEERLKFMPPAFRALFERDAR